jgi:hypothetical protein
MRGRGIKREEEEEEREREQNEREREEKEEVEEYFCGQLLHKNELFIIPQKEKKKKK